MADAKGNTTSQQGQQSGQQSNESQQALSGQDQHALQRRSGMMASHPFTFVRRMAEEMDRTFDRLFEDFGFTPRHMMRRAMPDTAALTTEIWTPRIEAFQDRDKFIVRAELPGLKPDNVEVSISDDAITLQGQRRQERKEEREGFYHNEISYGSFYRTIPLPEGAIGDSAEARFRNGVLEITIPAPPHEVSKGRKLEIKGESDQSGQR